MSFNPDFSGRWEILRVVFCPSGLSMGDFVSCQKIPEGAPWKFKACPLLDIALAGENGVFPLQFATAQPFFDRLWTTLESAFPNEVVKVTMVSMKRRKSYRNWKQQWQVQPLHPRHKIKGLESSGSTSEWLTTFSQAGKGKAKKEQPKVCEPKDIHKKCNSL